MQVLGGGFQVAMPEQNLDGAQVGAGLQQVSRPTVAQRMRGDAFGCRPDARHRYMRSRRFCRKSADRVSGCECVWGTCIASASASASTLAASPTEPDSEAGHDL